MTMRPAEYYANKYFPNLDDAEAMLERWRIGASKTREEKDAVWVWASETIHRLSRRYYGRSQNTSRRYWWQPHRVSEEHDAHNTRVMNLLEMLGDPKYANRSAVWVITAFKRRFAQIEAMEQLRAMGIGLTDWGEALHEQSIPVIQYVYCAKLERRIADRGVELTNESLREEWETIETNYGRPLTEQRYRNFLKRWAWFYELKSMTYWRKPYRPEDVPVQNMWKND